MKFVKKFFYLFVISLSIALFISLILLYNYFDVMLRSSKIESKDGYVSYSIQHEDNPINKDIECFDYIYKKLKSYESDQYSYYELYFQYLENIDEEGAFYSEETDELENLCYGIKCMQVSQNIINNCNIKCTEGRLFYQNDYIYDGNRELPILMGSEYKSKYNIGDVFEWYYLFDKYRFKIIGFLEPKSNIHIGPYNLNLDRYIIMPFFDVAKDMRITDGLKIHYANKTSGIVELNNEKSTFFNDVIEPLLISAEVGEYSWTAYPLDVQFKDTFGVSITLLQRIIVVLEFFILSSNLIIIFMFSKHEYYQGKSFHFNDLLYGLIIFVIASLLYCVINYIYITFAGIMVYRSMYFIVIGLMSFTVILCKKIICEDIVIADNRKKK